MMMTTTTMMCKITRSEEKKKFLSSPPPTLNNPIITTTQTIHSCVLRPLHNFFFVFLSGNTIQLIVAQNIYLLLLFIIL